VRQDEESPTENHGRGTAGITDCEWNNGLVGIPATNDGAPSQLPSLAFTMVFFARNSLRGRLWIAIILGTLSACLLVQYSFLVQEHGRLTSINNTASSFPPHATSVATDDSQPTIRFKHTTVLTTRPDKPVVVAYAISLIKVSHTSHPSVGMLFPTRLHLG
jgi:hypothetical protein